MKWQRTYQRRLTALETQEKNDRDRNTHIAGNSWRVHWSIPGEIWMRTNQIREIIASAHVSREFRARALQASLGI